MPTQGLSSALLQNPKVTSTSTHAHITAYLMSVENCIVLLPTLDKTGSHPLLPSHNVDSCLLPVRNSRINTQRSNNSNCVSVFQVCDDVLGLEQCLHGVGILQIRHLHQAHDFLSLFLPAFAAHCSQDVAVVTLSRVHPSLDENGNTLRNLNGQKRQTWKVFHFCSNVFRLGELRATVW